MAVKNNLKQLRMERNLQQSDVAEAVMTDARSISRYETGKRNPSLEMALRLAAYLEINVDQIFEIE